MATNPIRLHPEHTGAVRNAADVSPYSSALVGITLIGNHQEIGAVLRTAVLLARTFKAQLSVEFSRVETFVVDPIDELRGKALKKVLDPIYDRLRKLASSAGSVLVVEADFTAASFLCTGTIAIRIHVQEPAARRKTRNGHPSKNQRG